MHTFFLFVAYLFSATLATPVAQLFDSYEDDKAATIDNKQGMQNFPLDLGTEGLQQAGENDAPTFLIGDATTNYLQAQVPSQDTFSNFGGECPSGDLFCCRGGSGPPDSLITDDAFNEKCIPCTFYLLYHTHAPKAALPHCFANKLGNAKIDNDENTGNERCQQESNGSCCQPRIAAGAVSSPHPPPRAPPTTEYHQGNQNSP